MIPQSGIGGEKSKLAQARLQEVCCFSAPFALRLHPSSSLSVLIRVIRGSFFPPSAQRLFGSAVTDALLQCGSEGFEVWATGRAGQKLGESGKVVNALNQFS